MISGLVGCWKVIGTEMTEGKVVSLIAGLPGEIVEFTENQTYRVDLASKKPSVYVCRTVGIEEGGELDVWQSGLETLVSKCLYKVDEDLLTICVAGNYKDRPSRIERNDTQLWCIMTFVRTSRPKKLKIGRKGISLPPGSFIPKEFLNGSEE